MTCTCCCHSEICASLYLARLCISWLATNTIFFPFLYCSAYDITWPQTRQKRFCNWVSLYVCVEDNSKSCGWIWSGFSGSVAYDCTCSRKWWNFESEVDQSQDYGFSPILGCLQVYWKLLTGFDENSPGDHSLDVDIDRLIQNIRSYYFS